MISLLAVFGRAAKPFKEEQAVHRFHMAEPITAQGVWRPYTLISRLDNGYFKCPPNLRTNKHTRHIVIWMPVLLCAIEYSTKHSGLLPHQRVLSLHAPYSQIEYLATSLDKGQFAQRQRKAEYTGLTKSTHTLWTMPINNRSCIRDWVSYSSLSFMKCQRELLFILIPKRPHKRPLKAR